MADYVQRMVEGLARALARIAAGRKAGRLADAPAELAELAAQVAGIDLNLLDVVGAEAVASQLPDRRQLEALAAICEERAELEAARADAAGAARWREHAAVFRARAG
jgi:sigma54-dependent transcription regulator